MTLGMGLAPCPCLRADEVDTAIATLQRVEPNNQGNQLAAAAVRVLQQSTAPESLVRVLNR